LPTAYNNAYLATGKGLIEEFKGCPFPSAHIFIPLFDEDISGKLITNAF